MLSEVSIYQKNFKEKGRAGKIFGASAFLGASLGPWLPIHENRVALAVVDREKFTKQNHGAEFHWIYKIKNNHESFDLRQLLRPNG